MRKYLYSNEKMYFTHIILYDTCKLKEWSDWKYSSLLKNSSLEILEIVKYSSLESIVVL